MTNNEQTPSVEVSPPFTIIIILYFDLAARIPTTQFPTRSTKWQFDQHDIVNLIALRMHVYDSCTVILYEEL